MVIFNSYVKLPEEPFFPSGHRCFGLWLETCDTMDTMDTDRCDARARRAEVGSPAWFQAGSWPGHSDRFPAVGWREPGEPGEAGEPGEPFKQCWLNCGNFLCFFGSNALGIAIFKQQTISKFVFVIFLFLKHGLLVSETSAHRLRAHPKDWVEEHHGAHSISMHGMPSKDPAKFDCITSEGNVYWPIDYP